MKLSTKIYAGLAAFVLAASPLLTTFSMVQPVQAATAKKGKSLISLVDVAYVYDDKGQKIKAQKGHELSYYVADVNGYYHTDPVETEGYPNLGTKIIGGQEYYRVDKGLYFNAADIKEIGGKNIKKGKLILNHKSRLYTKSGKATWQTLAKNDIVSYQGQVKTTETMPKYFYYQYDIPASKQLIRYLPTRQIKGKYAKTATLTPTTSPASTVKSPAIMA